MAELTFANIENYLFPYRSAGRRIKAILLGQIVADQDIHNPFLMLSRFFMRLKSADSILEKIKRKGLAVQSTVEIDQKIDDLLGFRIITSNLEELYVLDQFLCERFTLHGRRDMVDPPGKYGYRSIEYKLSFSDGEQPIPFEVQLRTFLQHCWSSSSFFLFHKALPERAMKQEWNLVRLSQLLWEAEGIIEQLEDPIQKVATPLPASAYPAEILATLPVNNRMNLVIVEPGEVFLQHVVIPLAGDDLVDHAAIVNRKLALYSEHPGATVVECACINFYSYILNEPHVRVPASRLSQIIW